MNRRPWSVKLYAAVMLGIAIGFPVQIFMLQDLWQITKHMTMLNWTVMGLCFGLSVLAWRADRKVIWLSAIAVPITALNNWWVGEVALDYSPEQALLGTMAFIGVHALLFERNAMAIFRNQNLRWWMRATRYRAPYEVVVSPWVGEVRKARVFDISTTGAFIQCPEQMLAEFEEGEPMQLRIGFDHAADMNCTATLIRKSLAKGDYPTGFGVEFNALTREQKSMLTLRLDH